MSRLDRIRELESGCELLPLPTAHTTRLKKLRYP